MKLFSEYLKESEEKESSGTYAAMLLDKDSRDNLYDWLSDHKIKNLIEPAEYHCTVVYSVKSVPEVADIEVDLPIEAKIIGWKVFGDEKLLVAILESNELHKLFDETIKIGAKTDYPEYISHISVAKNYDKEVPEKFPDFSVLLNRFKVDTLDADFNYSTE